MAYRWREAQSSHPRLAETDRDVGYQNPTSRTSRTPARTVPQEWPGSARGRPRGGALVAEGERLDHLEVGHQVRLLILFDGSAALRQPSVLEIGPRPGGDAAHADRAEPEGRRACSRTRRSARCSSASTSAASRSATASRSKVGFFDQQAVIRRVAPGRQQQERLRRIPSRCWAAVTAATTWNSESFSPVRLEKCAPLFRNSISGALPWKPTQRTRSWIW